jgi:hypothetical protein
LTRTEVAGVGFNHDQLGDRETLLDLLDCAAHPDGDLWINIEVASGLLNETGADGQLEPLLIIADTL